jgi:hypothetical protein
MSVLTMLDLAKRQNSSKEVGLIEANLSSAPELANFPARTIKGTSYHTLLRTGLPSAAFTHVNEGVAASKSTYANKLVECFPIRALIQIDKALISADNSQSSLETDESMGVTEAVMRLLGRQIYYGKAYDAKGHIGLQDVVGSSMTLDAGGTTDNVASSVYFVKYGIKDVQVIFGNGTVLTLPAFRDETAEDASGGKFDARVSHLTGWAGIQCTNPNSVVRIRDLTTDSGKGLTDALLAAGLALFPAGVMPDAIYMSRRSRSQLQIARSAVAALQLTGKKGEAGGSSVYAPTPTDFEGIPIIATDSILNTETLS